MQMFAGPNEWPRTKSEAAAAGNCCSFPSSTLSSLSLCLHPTGQSTAVGHCTRHPAPGNRQPALGIVDVSLGIFNTRLHLRLPNVISGTTTAACATVTCPTCPQATPLHSLFTPLLVAPVSIAASGSAMDPNGPMGDCCYSMSLRYQLRTVESMLECEFE